MSGRYWESEQPAVVTTGKNVLRWYAKAGRLQIAKPDWQDEGGQTRMGKAVTLDVRGLEEAEEADLRRAVGILGEILGRLKEAA